MAYLFYLGEILLPITPGKLTTKINSNNKTVTLINEGEINILKDAGLTDISFEALIPNSKYPFSSSRELRSADYYLGIFEKLKTSKEPFQFIVLRTKPNGDYLYDTNISVSMEDYTITEDADKYGFDIGVSIKLKQYKVYGTKVLYLKEKTTTSSTETTTKLVATVEDTRASNKSKNSTHTVKSGETLWVICQKELGDGSKYTEIAKLNGISNPNLIKVGQVIKFE